VARNEPRADRLADGRTALLCDVPTRPFAAAIRGARLVLSTPESRSIHRATAGDPEGRRVRLEEVKGLLRNVKHCLDLLPEPGVHVALAATREGVFFAGQRTDAMKLVLDIVALARTRLEVIDGYIDLGTLGVLTREPKLSVEVLTKPPDAATAQAIVAFAKGKRLQVRTSNAFHDRFVCVDGTDVYHFGASFKDAGARGFMFSRLEEPAVIKALRDQWAHEWGSGGIVV